MIIKINRGKKSERVIGELDYEQHVFSKKVSLSKHLFRKYDAWGIDAQYFTDALLPTNYFVKIYEVEEGKIYRTDAETIKKHGFFFHFKEENGRDNRAQIFLSRRFWQVAQL